MDKYVNSLLEVDPQDAHNGDKVFVTEAYQEDANGNKIAGGEPLIVSLPNKEHVGK